MFVCTNYFFLWEELSIEVYPASSDTLCIRIVARKQTIETVILELVVYFLGFRSSIRRYTFVLWYYAV